MNTTHRNIAENTVCLLQRKQPEQRIPPSFPRVNPQNSSLRFAEGMRFRSSLNIYVKAPGAGMHSFDQRDIASVLRNLKCSPNMLKISLIHSQAGLTS